MTNLFPNVTAKDLHGNFHEAGFVFDVFIPRNKNAGGSRGFRFVFHKTE